MSGAVTVVAAGEDGDAMDEDKMDGDAMDEDKMDGDAMDEDKMDGDAMDEDKMDGDAMDEDKMDGDAMDEDKMDGDAMDEDKMDGDAMDEDKMDGDAMDEDKMDGDAMDEDKMDGDAMDEDKMDGDAMDEDKMGMMGDPSAMYALSDGTAIKLYSGEPTEGEQLEITVLFVDSEHVNYDLMVTQGDETVLEDVGRHEHQGMGTHTTAPLASSDPVDVTITFQGFGVTKPFTGDSIGEVAVFTGVVPEFGTIAMIILGVAVMSIVAVTARSRIVPRI